MLISVLLLPTPLVSVHVRHSNRECERLRLREGQAGRSERASELCDSLLRVSDGVLQQLLGPPRPALARRLGVLVNALENILSLCPALHEWCLLFFITAPHCCCWTTHCDRQWPWSW
jgi:hypothetical protein